MLLPKISDDVLARHDVLVSTDNSFQRRARLLQALGREQHGYPIGTNGQKKLGSRLDLEFGRKTLDNFLTDGIRDVVRQKALGKSRGEGQFIEETRLVSNLLSSQPLCFNLFGELARDHVLATRVLRQLTPGRIGQVVDVLFEYSPGRGDLRFTGDKSAFDVFIDYLSPTGAKGFLGIEVKYHESLGEAADPHRPRYDEVAETMGCFVRERVALQERPLQQIWRDHLLAGALVSGDVGYKEGAFVFLAPSDNVACSRAVEQYRKYLTRQDTFFCWSLEQVVEALDLERAPVATLLRDRYLAWGKVDEAEKAARGAPRASE